MKESGMELGMRVGNTSSIMKKDVRLQDMMDMTLKTGQG